MNRFVRIRFLVLSIIMLFTFLSCTFNTKNDNYIILSLNLEDTKTSVLHENLYDSTLNYISVEIGNTIYLNYKTIPEDINNIEILDVKSLDNNIISISNIDTANKIIIANALNIGETKIRIESKYYHSSTSLLIKIIK